MKKETPEVFQNGHFAKCPKSKYTTLNLSKSGFTRVCSQSRKNDFGLTASIFFVKSKIERKCIKNPLYLV